MEPGLALTKTLGCTRHVMQNGSEKNNFDFSRVIEPIVKHYEADTKGKAQERRWDAWSWYSP